MRETARNMFTTDQTNTPVRTAFIVAAALGLAACAPSFDAARSTVAPFSYAPTNPPSRVRATDNLTRIELDDLHGTTENAYSALERLRPFFLTPRPSAEIVHGEVPRVLVYINGYFSGDLDVLKTIPVASVESVRRVQSSMVMATMGEVRAGDMVLMVQVR